MRSDLLTELASGVDALYLSGRAALPGGLVDRLESGRKQSEELSSPLPFEFGGHQFNIAPRSWGRYRYVIGDELGRIGLSTSDHVPAIRIQPRAELLHAIRPEATVAGYRALVEAECETVHFSTSRLDLFVDLQGLELTAADRSRFVGRATNCRTFEEGARFRGFQFGQRSTKTFSARIYDKTADVERHGTDWWFGLWGDRYLAGQPVHRVEFEIGRRGLRDFGLDCPAQVLEAKGDLWHYATGEWLTLRCPTADTTRARWPLAPEWRQIQQASLRGEVLGLARIVNGRTAGSLRRLLPPLTGYLASFAAVTGTADIDDTLGLLDHHLRADEIRRSIPFRARVTERRDRSGPRRDKWEPKP
jgi:hypothetical protein